MTAYHHRNMPRYVSHKKVRALEIKAVARDPGSDGYALSFARPDYMGLVVPRDMMTRYQAQPGDFLVEYEDGYQSISPRKAFLEGYTLEDEAKHDGLPVAGYQPQSTERVTIVNVNKALEERVLRQLDQMSDAQRFDQRWLAIGRTAIEQGFMAINRAVFKPSRVKLPEDQA